MPDRQYSITPIDLTTAGRQQIDLEGDYFVFLTAETAAGTQDLDAKIEVAIGRAEDDFAPLQVNNTIEGYAEKYIVRWEAQSGITAYIFISRGPNPLKVAAPPAKQLITSALASTFVAAAVSVTNAATAIAAAASGRQRLAVINVGAQDVFLGGSSVTAAQGFTLSPGERYETDSCNGALYGIVAAGTCDVRVLREE